MKNIKINRQLLGVEDFLFGEGTEEQIRNGVSVLITKINAANLPFRETQTLLEWVDSFNLEALGNMVNELQVIYENLPLIDALEGKTPEIVALHTKLPQLTDIYNDLVKLEAIYSNLSTINTININLPMLNTINNDVVPNLTELLQVNDKAAQVASDTLEVESNKDIVAQDKSDVNTMLLAVQSIYDTFDDRFLGSKTIDPIVDNDGNPLVDGTLYFNTTSNALKVYDLGTQWITLPQIYLSSLLDVQLISIQTGDILTWNGTKWINTRTPKFDSIQLNGGVGTQGLVTWNNTELTLDLVLSNDITLQVGQADVLLVKNTTGTLIDTGKVVMVTGTNGNSGNILVSLHTGLKVDARKTLGITTESILNDSIGFVTKNGKVRGINTTGSNYGESWSNGSILYVTNTGGLTNIEPIDSELKMPIAYVVHAHSNGTLYVRTTGIDENHDIDRLNLKANLVNPKFTSNITIGNTDLSSWNSSISVIEGPGGTFFGSNDTAALSGSNAYYDGADWRYKVNGTAGLQLVTQGVHTFRVATTGLANDIITWVTIASLDANNVVLPANTEIGNVSAIELQYLSGVTSSVQTQLDNSLRLDIGGTIAGPVLANTTVGTTPIVGTAYTKGIGTSGIVLNTRYPLFPVTSGTITLDIGTYKYEIFFQVTVATSTTSTALALSIGGAGTALGTQSFNGTSAIIEAGAATLFSLTPQALTNTMTVTAASAVAGRVYQVLGTGIINITTAGTIIPSYVWPIAPVSGVVTLAAENYMCITPLSSSATGTVGGWN